MVDFAADDGDDHHQLLMMVIIIISFDGGHHLQFLQQGKGRLSLKPATHILSLFFAIQKCINDDENDGEKGGENNGENNDDNDCGGDDTDDGHWLELSDRHRSLTCLLLV